MKRNILVYDDDDEILLLCRTILERNNYAVTTLNRCVDVVADVLLYAPQVILMDLWIPDIGGEKAAQILKSNKELKNIPLLLFSANADIDVIADKVGADGYIAKPFLIRDYLDSIEKHIN